MLAADGGLRDPWRGLATAAELADPTIMPQRAEELRRLVADLGITYNVYGNDPRGNERSWPIDILPVPISVGEWKDIEAGVLQRAWVLDRLLADLYGPRAMVAQGLVPPEMLFANPGLMRGCHGIEPRDGRWIHLYAADLVRGPDGRWTLLADRCQSPSGLGYALENRALLTRVLPEPIRTARVRRLDGFVERLREGLEVITRRDDPRLVLLTPGPFNETYFEHVALARRMGLNLVMGDDLSVRDDRVYLKTLSGLQRVDVILRRLDDSWCDPLALRPDSTLGVAGLTEAARAGNVIIANALGTGATESALVSAIFPALCRTLLDEAPRLPAVETLWAATPGVMARVEAAPGDWIARPAFSGTGGSGAGGSADIVFERLDSMARGSAFARIARQPYAWVFQPRLPLSTAPCWIDRTVVPRPIVLRVFAAAGADGSFAVMPGGLVRYGADDETPQVTMQRGGGAKDLWLQATGVADIVRAGRSTRPALRLRRDVDDLPSRVADHLYWLGRYVERVDGAMRLGRSLLVRASQTGDGTRGDAALPSAPFGRVLGEYGVPLPLTHSAWIALLSALPFGGPNTGLFDNTLRGLVRVVRNLTDRLPGEAQRLVAGLAASPIGLTPRVTDALAVYDHRLSALAAFQGTVGESMPRDQAWPFLEIGRRLERALALMRLISASSLDQVPDESVLSLLLEIAESAPLYRRRYHAAVQLDAVLDVLFSDPANPRSVLFQIDQIQGHLGKLPRMSNDGLPTALEIAIERARATTRLADALALARLDLVGRRPDLAAALERVGQDLRHVSDYLTRDYFRVETMTSERANR